MKLTLSLGLLVVGALVAPAAFPCGAPFGTGINVDPKQDIVVVHKNGVETYAFQPRFCGTASEFGLILPIPAKLSSAPALSKANVFTQVVKLSQPEYRTQTICGTGGMKGGSTGASGGSGSDNGGPTVVSSGTVGFMDYTQLKADTTASFTEWLDKNGYPYDTLAKDAFSYYVEKGWYLLAFKISQGVVSTGSSVCKDLGPVKLSFPSELPVVPTRMATARNRDASGALSYASNFSWRIFGITEAAKQIYFTDGLTSRRTFGYSGLLLAEDIAVLDGLAVTGDRLAKLTVTFDYGSKDPDIALSLVGGNDYREYITTYSYVVCPDAAVPDAPVSKTDTAIAVDAGAAPVDTTPALAKDAEPPRPDTANKLDTVQEIPVKLDAALAPDTAVTKPVQADAGVPVSATPDAAKPTTTEEPSEKKSGGGCSLASGSVEHGLASLLVLALALVIRRRRS
jgi:MYXO-CTERM domain-containing protein